MSVKNEKIMIFVGSAEAKVFADSLAEYTDSVYAVVSERYGSRQHVSGNITVISRFLDKDSIKSWVARVGVSVLVELGLDYFKISSSIDVDFTHTSKCKNAEEIVKDASYTVGNVLLIGCSELAEDVVTKRDGALRDRVVAVLPPEEENIRTTASGTSCEGNPICSIQFPNNLVNASNSPEARRIPTATIKPARVGKISTAVINPFFAPFTKSAYALRRFRKPDIRITTIKSGMIRSDKNSNIACIRKAPFYQ